MEISNFIPLFIGVKVYIILIAFVVFSYLFLAVLNWSFIKPLKYMGVSIIIVGIVLFLLSFIFPTIIDLIIDSLKIPIDVVLYILKPITYIGIAYFVIGIIMLVIPKLLKNKKVVE